MAKKKKDAERIRRVGGMMQGNLHYLVSDSVLLFANTPFGSVKMCRIRFGSDGSIYVPFPYLGSKRGILSALTDDPRKQGPVTYDLAANGVSIDYDVKFSHHTSGDVHFSRTGKADLLPERHSFDLQSGSGIVFMFYVLLLRGFTPLETKTTKGELRIGLNFERRHPFGVMLTAEWAPKKMLLAKAALSRHPVGPSALVTDKIGNTKRVIFVGQPPELPLQDHLLVLSAAETHVPETTEQPTMVFFGGIDHPDAEKPGALAFVYPYRGDPIATFRSALVK
jgi:hypothetical protein